ncbi:MAG: hypothetical protein ACOYKE_09385 [Ferruginibacter sp.]
MKTTNLFVAIAATLLIGGFASCKKTDATKDTEIETTVEMSGDQAVADNLTEDASDVVMDAAEEKGLAGERPTEPFQATGILNCATVTVTPLIGFPKTIVVDFGTGCAGPGGIFRKGKMNIVLSDTLRHPGATSVVTFDNYFINGFKKEGTITWTNTSTPSTRSWRRTVVNGKITAPNGRYWLHTGIKEVVQTAGVSTPRNLLDDVYSITGTHTVTKMNGVTRTSTIIEPLQKKTICENIDKGVVKVQGPNHYAIINYGNGDCDRVATISIDGGTPINFLLR